MKNWKARYWFIFLTLVIQACNLPSSADPNQPGSALTITALAAAPTPAAPGQDTQTPLPQFTPTIALTPTPLIPIVTVSQNTNCRTGPSTQYDLIGALLVGETAEVVGKNSATNYLVIKTPGGSGTCWLWGQYATVSGNISLIPEVAIPPTPTPSPTPTPAEPHAVKNVTANKICILLPGPQYQYLGTITWEDKSDNEAGFNIYMNGGLFTVLGPDVTVYALPGLIFPPGVPIKYGVEAFNDAGKALKKEVTITCP